MKVPFTEEKLPVPTEQDLKILADMETDEYKKRFSETEESYRRGYHQGFFAARSNPELTDEEVRSWRYSREYTAPPGSGRAGHKF